MISIAPSFVHAKGVIRFPDQELAADYAFPVFEKTRAVLNRNVTLKNRVELRLSSGLRVDEPLYHFLGFLGSLSFYWNESSGIGLSTLFFMPGLSQRGRALQQKGVKRQFAKNPDGTIRNVGEEVGFFFDVGLAPKPLFASFLNYQFNPLYGKISLTKRFVFNFALYSFLGLGAIAYKHGDEPLMFNPAAHIGFGQRFYFSRYIALEGGIDCLAYRGPNPILSELKYEPDQSKPGRPSYTAFKKDLFFRLQARFGMTFLL